MKSISLVSNVSASLAMTLLVTGLGFFTKLLIARSVSPAEAGIFFSWQSVYIFAIIVISLGLPEACLQTVARSRDAVPNLNVLRRQLLMTTLLFFLLVSVPTFLAYLLNFWKVVALSSLTLLIVWAAVPLKLTLDLVGAELQGRGRLDKKLLLVDVFPAIGFTAALLFLQFMGRLSSDLLLLAFLMPISVISMFALLYYWLRKDFFYFSSSTGGGLIVSRDIFGFSLPLWAGSLISSFMGMAPAIISTLDTPTSAALVTIAVTLTSFVFFTSRVIEAALTSEFANLISRGKHDNALQRYRNAASWAVLACSIPFAFFWIVPLEVVTSIFGSEYAAIGHFLPWLALCALSSVALGPAEAILKALDKTLYIMAARVATGAFSILVSFSLIGLFKLNGAIIAQIAIYLFSSWVVFGSYLFIKLKIFPFCNQFFRVVLSILIGVASVDAILHFCMTTVAINRIIFVAIFYPISLLIFLLALRGVSISQLQALKKAIF